MKFLSRMLLVPKSWRDLAISCKSKFRLKTHQTPSDHFITQNVQKMSFQTFLISDDFKLRCDRPRSQAGVLRALCSAMDTLQVHFICWFLRSVESLIIYDAGSTQSSSV